MRLLLLDAGVVPGEDYMWKKTKDCLCRIGLQRSLKSRVIIASSKVVTDCERCSDQERNRGYKIDVRQQVPTIPEQAEGADIAKTRDAISVHSAKQVHWSLPSQQHGNREEVEQRQITGNKIAAQHEIFNH